MDFNLVVVIPFGSYAKGDLISNDGTITNALESNAASVVKVARPAEPDPAPEPNAALPPETEADTASDAITLPLKGGKN